MKSKYRIVQKEIYIERNGIKDDLPTTKFFPQKHYLLLGWRNMIPMVVIEYGNNKASVMNQYVGFFTYQIAIDYIDTYREWKRMKSHKYKNILMTPCILNNQVGWYSLLSFKFKDFVKEDLRYGENILYARTMNDLKNAIDGYVKKENRKDLNVKIYYV